MFLMNLPFHPALDQHLIPICELTYYIEMWEADQGARAGLISRKAQHVPDKSRQVLGNRERFGLSYMSVLFQDLETFAPVVARLSGK